MVDPVTALIAYFIPGFAYGAWCLGGLVGDGVPVRGIPVCVGLIKVVGAWPLVLLMVGLSKAKRMARRAWV